MSRQSPAFQFYADDFFAGVLDLTDEECGVYIKLLCIQWSKGIVHDDIDRHLKTTFRCTAELLTYVLDAKFEPVGNGWKNERLEETRKIQQERSKAGSKGGSKRQANTKQNSSKTQANGQAKLNPPSPSPSPSPSPLPTPLPSSPPPMVESKTTASRQNSTRIDLKEIDLEEADRIAVEVGKVIGMDRSDALLRWRCGVLLAAGAISEHQLFDSLAAVRSTKPSKPGGYLIACLREAVAKDGRDWDVLTKRVPPTPKPPAC